MSDLPNIEDVNADFDAEYKKYKAEQAAPSNIALASSADGQGQKMDVPQRQPLTQRRIFQLAALSGCGSYQSDYDAQIKYDRCLEQFARAIEKAHNIGGAT